MSGMLCRLIWSAAPSCRSDLAQVVTAFQPGWAVCAARSAAALLDHHGLVQQLGRDCVRLMVTQSLWTGSRVVT
jgi:hypothetical protein